MTESQTQHGSAAENALAHGTFELEGGVPDSDDPSDIEIDTDGDVPEIEITETDHPEPVESMDAEEAVTSNVTPLHTATASGWFAVEPDHFVRGWCMDRKHPRRRLLVEIRIDGTPVGRALANRPHAKLIELGEGDGYYAFALAIPPEFRDGDEHTVEAVVTSEGYETVPLKIKNSSFTVPNSSVIPSVLVQRVSPDGIEGVALIDDPDLAGQLDVWLDGERLALNAVHTNWTGFGGGKAQFRLEVLGRNPLSLLSRAVQICIGGVGESLRDDGSLKNLVEAQAKPDADGNYEISIGSGILIPSGTVLKAQFKDEDGRHLGTKAVRFDDNRGTFVPGDDEELDGVFLTLIAPGDITIAEDVLLLANPPRRLATNGAFSAWLKDGTPEDWQLGSPVHPERGHYAFPRNLKAQYGLSGNTAIFPMPPSDAQKILLRQPLKRTARLGQTATDVNVGFLARSSSAAELELRLLDAQGSTIASARFAVGAKWKVGSKTFTISRQGAPSAVTFEVGVRPLSTEEATYFEIAGLRCGTTPDEHFDDFELRPSAGGARSDTNLVTNADLQNWPSGLALSDRRSRFEIADGWFLFNRRATTAARAASIPVPTPAGGTPRYGLSLSVPAVPEYCRLEISLDTTELMGRGLLQFNAACIEAFEEADSRFSFDRQWANIDKIFVLKRETIVTGGRTAQTDTTVATVARRVLLTRNWEPYTFAFEFEATGDDSEFESSIDDEKLIEHLLVLEFRRPTSISLHSVDLRLTTKPAPALNAALQLEDGNIRAQASNVKGLELWNSPTVCQPAIIENSREEAAALRWNWMHSSLGSVDIGICVYNAADETLDCLRSLVGSTTVPHTVRIINDGSDEDCRQRILQFIADKPWMKLYDNGANRGYTASANRAILESDADWVILLNSDTIVSKGWIEGMLEVAASDPKIAFVGPVSNAATYQSVPELYDGAGKWAINSIPEGWTVEDVAAVVAAGSTRAFPEAPLLNGFCTLIKRAVFAEIGGLNEKLFPAGYGEENDLCVRATKAGYKLHIADHVYVYHVKSASFGSARRLELAKAGDKALRAMHHEVDFGAMGKRFLETPALAQLREAVRKAYKVPPAGKSNTSDRGQAN